MLVIEPCCYPKHLQMLFSQLSKQKAESISYWSNGDWILGQLIEWLVWLAPSGSLTLMLPDISESTITSLHRVMERMDHPVGKQAAPLIGYLRIVVNPKTENKILLNKLKETYPDRVSLGTDKLVSNGFLLIEGNAPVKEDGYRMFSFIGDLNQTIDYNSRVVVVSKDESLYRELFKFVDMKIRTHRL